MGNSFDVVRKVNPARSPEVTSGTERHLCSVDGVNLAACRDLQVPVDILTNIKVSLMSI